MPSRRCTLTAVGAIAAGRYSSATPTDRFVRREFVDTLNGQIHIRRAGQPVPGGPTPTFCFHQSPQSSLVYADLLPYLAVDRMAIACDTPGFGESFRPQTQQPTVSDYAAWLAEVPRSLGITSFDAVGMFTGTAIAVEMQRLFPMHIRRMALIGPALFDEGERRDMLARAWPERPSEDGGFFLREWKRVFDRYPTNMPINQKFAAYGECYRGGANAIFGEVAVNSYDMRVMLPRVSLPVLIIDPEGTAGRGGEAHAGLAGSTYVKADGKSGLGLLQSEPVWVADQLLRFFDTSRPG